jgi:hypothetical protein
MESEVNKGVRKEKRRGTITSNDQAMQVRPQTRDGPRFVGIWSTQMFKGSYKKLKGMGYATEYFVVEEKGMGAQSTKTGNKTVE